MLRVYALAPATLRRMLRQMLLRFLGFTTFSFLLFGIYLAFFAGPVRWLFAGLVVALIALAYFFIIFFTYRQELRLLYSVRYELSSSSITYRQRGKPPLTVMRADVVWIEQTRRGLYILTVPGSPELFVPYGLSRGGDENLRRTLAVWTGATLPVRSRRHAQRARAIRYGLGGALLVLLFANQFWLIIPLGVLTLVYGLYTERRMSKKPETDPGAVRMYSAAFTFVFFVISMKACLMGMVFLMAH